jgi:GMP synthase (glutamine-hydrolysing)
VNNVHLHWLQHVPFERPGSILDWAEQRGAELSCTPLYAGGELPQQDTFDVLVVMGGPMGVDDEQQYPWLHAEKKFLEQAMSSGKAVLGICLGAQLIAQVAGGRVSCGTHREIGWFEVTRAPEAAKVPVADRFPERYTAFHWHGDTFTLPEGAVHLGSSEGCANQGFLLNERILALQFHLEMTRPGVAALVTACVDEMEPGPFVQQVPHIFGKPEYYAETNRIMVGLLDALIP